ncbi:MAG: hypothetical protein PHW07_01925 [Sulfurospirillaceae bacterium]|nr:hypothetical protein [Sulfurospirillaceae bacterium]
MSTISFANNFRDAMLSYKNGEFEKAKILFEKSIKEESASLAYYFLGIMHLKGQGTAENSSQAIPYLEQAALKGNLKAKCFLAEAYIKNKDKKDEVLSLLKDGIDNNTKECIDIAATYGISIK